MARRTSTPRSKRVAPRRWSGRCGFVKQTFAVASLCWFAIVSVGVPQQMGWSGAATQGVECRCDPARKRAGQCCCRQPASSQRSDSPVRSQCCSTSKRVLTLDTARDTACDTARDAVCKTARDAARNAALDAATCESGRPTVRNSASKKTAPCCSKRLTPRSLPASGATQAWLVGGNSGTSGSLGSTGTTGASSSQEKPTPPHSEGGRRQSFAMDGCGCGSSGSIPGLIRNQDPRVGGNCVALSPVLPCVGWVESPAVALPTIYALPPVPPPRLDVI
jgi:hypothetical protein